MIFLMINGKWLIVNEVSDKSSSQISLTINN